MWTQQEPGPGRDGVGEELELEVGGERKRTQGLSPYTPILSTLMTKWGWLVACGLVGDGDEGEGSTLDR
jgi:hypothetical protein